MPTASHYDDGAARGSYQYTDPPQPRATGGLLVVAICWPIARGDRQSGNTKSSNPSMPRVGPNVAT